MVEECVRTANPMDASTVSGRAEAAALDTRLQRLVLRSMLSEALDALRSKGSLTDRENAACWLLQNASSIFGDLADVAKRRLEAGFTQRPGFAVDADAARKFLQDVLSPAASSLRVLLETGGPAQSAGPEHAVILCLNTMLGIEDIALLIWRIDAQALITGSAAEWA